jgi:hypothetical protein
MSGWTTRTGQVLVEIRPVLVEYARHCARLLLNDLLAHKLVPDPEAIALLLTQHLKPIAPCKCTRTNIDSPCQDHLCKGYKDTHKAFPKAQARAKEAADAIAHHIDRIAGHSGNIQGDVDELVSLLDTEGTFVIEKMLKVYILAENQIKDDASLGNWSAAAFIQIFAACAWTTKAFDKSNIARMVSIVRALYASKDKFTSNEFYYAASVFYQAAYNMQCFISNERPLLNISSENGNQVQNILGFGESNPSLSRKNSTRKGSADFDFLSDLLESPSVNSSKQKDLVSLYSKAETNDEFSAGSRSKPDLLETAISPFFDDEKKGAENDTEDVPASTKKVKSGRKEVLIENQESIESLLDFSLEKATPSSSIVNPESKKKKNIISESSSRETADFKAEEKETRTYLNALIDSSPEMKKDSSLNDNVASLDQVDSQIPVNPWSGENVLPLKSSKSTSRRKSSGSSGPFLPPGLQKKPSPAPPGNPLLSLFGSSDSVPSQVQSKSEVEKLESKNSNVFLRAKKKTEAKGKECTKRYLCIRDVDKHSHSDEISRFFEYRSQFNPKYWHNFKLLSCPSAEHSSESASSCIYAHSPEDSFCIKCKEWGHVLTFHKQNNSEVVELLRSQLEEAQSSLSRRQEIPCEYRYRCELQLSCPKDHSLEERAYFHSFSGRFPIHSVKSVGCRYGSECVEGDMGCDYAHGPDDSWCVKCKAWGHLQASHAKP